MQIQVNIALIGISHSTAPVEIREQVTFDKSEQEKAIAEIKQKFKVDGCLIISTCNRTEVYLSGENCTEDITAIREWLNNFKKCTYFTDENISYIIKEIDAVQHFFKVISGIDSLIVGGGMAFTFFKAQGKEIGKSLLEEEKLDLAKELLEKVKTSKLKFLLPVDVVVADDFKNESPSITVDVENIPADKMGLDIGPKSIKLFSEELMNSKTIIWNGPMGVFEMTIFAKGTFAIAESLVKATENGAITVIGGGDSAAAISKAGLDKKVSHVSTGGGASLEFLEGKILPGVAALTDI